MSKSDPKHRTDKGCDGECDLAGCKDCLIDGPPDLDTSTHGLNVEAHVFDSIAGLRKLLKDDARMLEELSNAKTGHVWDMIACLKTHQQSIQLKVDALKAVGMKERGDGEEDEEEDYVCPSCGTNVANLTKWTKIEELSIRIPLEIPVMPSSVRVHRGDFTAVFDQCSECNEEK